MKALKRFVLAVVIVLACAGVYGALRNLPVASGCGFYGECPDTVDRTQTPPAQLTATAQGTAQ